MRAVVADRGLDVELAVAAGEVVAVLGPNGAGKSTTLDLIAGLLRRQARQLKRRIQLASAQRAAVERRSMTREKVLHACGVNGSDFGRARNEVCATIRRKHLRRNVTCA